MRLRRAQGICSAHKRRSIRRVHSIQNWGTAHLTTGSVQEISPGALEREGTQQRLTAALNSALEALSQVDLVLAATENCEADAQAAIWHAIARADDSVREALLLVEPEVTMLAASRAQGVDLGAVAPLSVAFYGVVAGVKKESKSVLFEVGVPGHGSSQICACLLANRSASHSGPRSAVLLGTMCSLLFRACARLRQAV